jgi:hypothetical protein
VPLNEGFGFHPRPETYAKRLEIFARAAEFDAREEITRAKVKSKPIAQR